ncbi:Conidiophore development regulator abaA [Fusarium oxysporum f. sp. albedinis]|nr:Conidiophore development regulator abaA [Fusarium oxysporum f. sp. albedinis]
MLEELLGIRITWRYVIAETLFTDQIVPERSSSSYVLSIEPDLPAVPIRDGHDQSHRVIGVTGWAQALQAGQALLTRRISRSYVQKLSGSRSRASAITYRHVTEIHSAYRSRVTGSGRAVTIGVAISANRFLRV